MSAFLFTWFLLLAGHALADYPLQGDFLAKAKNRMVPIPGVPFWQALFAHALIHGGVVAVIVAGCGITFGWLGDHALTRSYVGTLLNIALFFGALEATVHALIDDDKCKGRIGFNTDQALHVFCKAVWAVAVAAVTL